MKDAEMIKVDSSNIAKIGHDGETLAVEFKNGSCYHYKNVDVETFEEFAKSESKGRFFASRIKGKFEFKKITQSRKDKSDENRTV